MKEHHSHLRRPEVTSSKERRPGRVAEKEVGAQRGVEGYENQTSLLQASEVEVLSWKHVSGVCCADIYFAVA